VNKIILLNKQPDFGIEGEIRNPEDMVEGRLYTIFNKNFGLRRDNFEFLEFPDTHKPAGLTEKPIEDESDRCMRTEVRSRESEWAEGRVRYRYLTDCGLMPYENRWNDVNAVIEVADGKVYTAEDISDFRVGVLEDIEGVEAVVSTDNGAEVYTVLPEQVEEFADSNNISLNRGGYFDSDELRMVPFNLDQAHEMLEENSSSEAVRNQYIDGRNRRINSVIQTLTGGALQDPLSAGEQYEEIAEIEDIDSISFEEYEIFSDRLETEVSEGCVRQNLGSATKAFKQEVEDMGAVFYGVSRRSGQLEVDKYLAKEPIKDIGGDKTVDERQIDVTVLYEE